MRWGSDGLVWAGLLGMWVAAIPVSALAVDAPDATSMPVRRSDSGHLLVRATVAGGEGWFVLDTAASTSLLAPDFARQVLSEREVWREVSVAGVGGSVDAPVYRSIDVVLTDAAGTHERTLRDVVVLSVPHLQGTLDDPICGVLGLDLLRAGPVAIDLAAPSVDWSVVAPPKHSGEKLDKAPGKLLTALLAVQAEGADATAPLRTVRGVLDLGSPMTILNTHAATSLALQAGAPLDPASATFSGADGRSVEGLEARDLTCELVGSGTVVPCAVVVADVPVFTTLSMADEPAAVLGTDVIRRPFVLDARKARLWWR